MKIAALQPSCLFASSSPLTNTTDLQSLLIKKSENATKHKPSELGEILYAKSAFDRQTECTTVELAWYVEAPLNKVIQTLDPQTWSTWGKKIFKETYLLDEKTGEPLKDPPPPGTPWNGVLFERTTSYGIEVVNHLNFKSRSLNPNEGVHQFDYSLRRSLGMKFFGFNFKSGAAIDEGWIRLEKMGKGWKITGVKKLKFEPENKLLAKLLNYGSPIATKKTLVNFVKEHIKTLTTQCAKNP